MSDLRSPNDVARQRTIEAIPEAERTPEDRKVLEVLRSMSWYSPTALGDR